MTIFVTVILFLLLLYSQKLHDQKLNVRGLSLSPVLVMNCAWLMYGITPLFFTEDKIFPSNDHDISYMLLLSIAISSWCFGIWFGSKVKLKKSELGFAPFNKKKYEISGFSTLTIVIIVYFLTFYWVTQVFGNGLIFLTQQYGNYNVDGISSVTSTIPFAVAGLSFVVVLSSRSRILKIAILLVPIFFLLGGNRNIAIFILLGAYFCVNHGKQQNGIFLAITLLGAILAAAILAVAREYGILNILLGNSSNFEFSEALKYAGRYNEGEFGTMFRVSRYVNEVRDFAYFVPGYSYIISPIVNLVPTSLFPSRPDTIATVFSYAYANASTGEKIIGLGFSPIAEAQMNFDILLGIPIFLWGCVVSMLSRLSCGQFKSDSKIKFLAIAIVAASLNYFRIDFALYTKFIFITYIFSLFGYAVFTLKIRKW